MTKDDLPPWLRYDHESGVFTNTKTGREIGRAAKNGNYGKINIGRKQIGAHRAAWFMFFGEWPTGPIDHINRDTRDNRISNLRIVDLSENNWNRKGKEQITGAAMCVRGGNYYAMIRHRGKRHYIGTFKTKEDAASAYQEAAKRLRGEFHE